ncbi:MAG: hypothetical protein GY696_26055 [Gammaproteobacteria bacterium]|nr:hypothetical protein [Gammaproteobacteria bacterium]
MRNDAYGGRSVSVQVEEIVQLHTKEGMINYNKTGSEGVTIAWNNMQQEVGAV